MSGLITRPQADGHRFAVDLQAYGIQPIIAPMLEIIPLRPPPQLATHLAAAQALLFTSANAVRALATLSPPLERPVLTVGAATAVAAQAAGFQHVESADGNASDLARLVIERLDPQAGPVFHAVGTVGGGALRQALGKAGFTTRRILLYRARIPRYLPRLARQALRQAATRMTIAFFFSPRTAQAFVKLVQKAKLENTCGDMIACALSAPAAEPLHAFAWRQIAIATRPETAALLDIVVQLSQQYRQR